MRVDLGSDPPATALTEYYKIPAPGYGLRGMDVDSKVIVWTALASGQFASFDRRKCEGPLNGPASASAVLCPEGWSFYPFPGPNFAGRQSIGAYGCSSPSTGTFRPLTQ